MAQPVPVVDHDVIVVALLRDCEGRRIGDQPLIPPHLHSPQLNRHSTLGEAHARTSLDVRCSHPKLCKGATLHSPTGKSPARSQKWRVVAVKTMTPHTRARTNVPTVQNPPRAQIRRRAATPSDYGRPLAHCEAVTELNMEGLQEAVNGLVARIDAVLASDEARWNDLALLIAEVEELITRKVLARSRWADLKRHLRFQEPIDWGDIAGADWPNVRRLLLAAPAKKN